jgi:hypothetical protein
MKMTETSPILKLIWRIPTGITNLAIALGPSPTSTTGYVFMALDTGKIIIRSQFK